MFPVVGTFVFITQFLFSFSRFVFSIVILSNRLYCKCTRTSTEEQKKLDLLAVKQFQLEVFFFYISFFSSWYQQPLLLKTEDWHKLSVVVCLYTADAASVQKSGTRKKEREMKRKKAKKEKEPKVSEREME